MNLEVLITLLILVAGWLFTIYFYFWKERKRAEERTEYFAKSLEAVLPDIIFQSENYKKVADDISAINKFRYKLGVVTDLNLHFFYPNIIEDLHSFLTNNDLNKSHLVVKEITSAANGIEVQFENFKYNYRQFKELQEDNYERWNQGINNLLTEYDKLFKEDLQNEELTDLVKKIRSKVEDLQEIDANKVEEITKEFVIPVLKICQESGNIRSLGIKREAQFVIFAYENLQANIDHYTELFAKDSKQTQGYHDRLETKLRQIKELL